MHALGCLSVVFLFCFFAFEIIVSYAAVVPYSLRPYETSLRLGGECPERLDEQFESC